ncbi:hypothetical protein [Chthoniobacter flavus]|nr:hypothetical protein [Chthoniobacter flavus]
MPYLRILCCLPVVAGLGQVFVEVQRFFICGHEFLVAAGKVELCYRPNFCLLMSSDRIARAITVFNRL